MGVPENITETGRSREATAGKLDVEEVKCLLKCHTFGGKDVRKLNAYGLIAASTLWCLESVGGPWTATSPGLNPW